MVLTQKRHRCLTTLLKKLMARSQQTELTLADPVAMVALPRSSGVYIFKGDGQLPIYIGKSVDIRSRVQAHLRAKDEAEMMAQSRRVEFIETAGEIGALLLESHLIKTLNLSLIHI